ncbi:hypothetical protein KL948_003439 [Ogataea haglerorum]|nr:hypothetical protein KL948_003439 [Ogataea haglerorum]KAG7737473.1 hypothetical protein KL923_003862 [Ogataea haglerorum]KAG7787944.1 hypothetical protein KL910_003498 [Ogataea haglerorum]KAG7790083.1 hypothetical protein KL945_001621 [Ogataea haglerorum]
MSVALPLYEDEECSDYLSPSPRQVLRISINLKTLIDKVIPIPLKEEQILGLDSIVLTDKLIDAVLGAAGGEGPSRRRYQACLVFCLLKVSEWYYSLTIKELSDDTLYATRMLAAQKIAATLIEREQDEKYLFISMLCNRYSINLHDVDSAPENALELAVDTHATIIISSGGYQRCLKWIWRGWIVQSSTDSSNYVLFKGTGNTSFFKHFDPDRIKTPLYQNILEITFSVLYLALFTFLVNTDTNSSRLGAVEVVFYLFTIGFALDELVKFYHVGYYYMQFSNVFNDVLYAIVIASASTRFIALAAHSPEKRGQFNVISYRLLSLAAPFMWSRLLLFLDVLQFCGTMIVVVKKMIRESFIFFFLLAIITVGFLQAFVGLDQADGKRELTSFLTTTMVQTVLGGPNFDTIERFAYPYGAILYYAYTFIVVLVLLNILIALYSQAYGDVVGNATDEYLAQYSAKILRYVRAPDDKTFCPPLNLVETVFLQLPFSWWLDRKLYLYLCDKVMVVLYLPVLLFIASYEVQAAKRVEYNRNRKVADDNNEEDTPWDLTDGFDHNDENGDGIRASIQTQRRAELEDPGFAKNFKVWEATLDQLVPPIEPSKDAGVSWENYEIYRKLDELTQAVIALEKKLDSK